MRKSIFGSLVMSCFAVISVVAIVMMLYFFTFIEQFAIEEKSRLFSENIDELEEATYVALVNQSDTTDILFQNIIDTVSANTKSHVTVFDINGVIISTSGAEPNANYIEKVDGKVSKPVLNGKGIQTVNMYKDKNGDKILTVAMPLKHKGEIYGGVMFNQRVPEIKKIYGYVSDRSLAILIIAVIMVALFFYIICYRITQPINKISAAVSEFSKGNFKKRVEYTSQNELGVLAENINNMAASLDNLEGLRNSFISDVSHELRTPLTTISGFVEGIIDGTVPEENRDEYLEIVLSETKRLSRLITNLLQVTRMDSGDMKLDRTDFDINELVRQTLLKFEMMITPKNIDVLLNIKEGKLLVNADKDNISQVLINLINNAVKFTDEGGSIAIDIDDESDKVWVSVTNTGRGIEKEHIAHVWDRFYKTDKSRSRERTGVGLGLYIVRKIMTLHGESVTVESKVNEYTRFAFSLKKSDYYIEDKKV